MPRKTTEKMDKIEISQIFRSIEELIHETIDSDSWQEAQYLFDKIKVEVEKLPATHQQYVWQSVAFSFLSNMDYARKS